MPGGLLGTGTQYENSSLQGFVRGSQMEQERNMAEDQLKAQKNVQQTQMITEGVGIGTMILFAALL